MPELVAKVGRWLGLVGPASTRPDASERDPDAMTHVEHDDERSIRKLVGDLVVDDDERGDRGNTRA